MVGGEKFGSNWDFPEELPSGTLSKYVFGTTLGVWVQMAQLVQGDMKNMG